MSDANFKKSSFCAFPPLGMCVEVAIQDEGVLLRDSKDPDKVLSVNSEAWLAFICGVKNGEFDLT